MHRSGYLVRAGGTAKPVGDRGPEAPGLRQGREDHVAALARGWVRGVTPRKIWVGGDGEYRLVWRERVPSAWPGVRFTVRATIRWRVAQRSGGHGSSVPAVRACARDLVSRTLAGFAPSELPGARDAVSLVLDEWHAAEIDVKWAGSARVSVARADRRLLSQHLRAARVDYLRHAQAERELEFLARTWADPVRSAAWQVIKGTKEPDALVFAELTRRVSPPTTSARWHA